MSRNRPDGTREPTNFFEAAAWHYSVKVYCGWCGHAAIFDPHALWWHFHQKHWDDDLAGAAKRFDCKVCRRNFWTEGKGRAKISLGSERPTDDSLPLPPEAEWKRAISRFRS